MKTIALLVCAMALVGGEAHAQRARTRGAAGVLAIQAEDPADSLFRLGRSAVNDNDYRRAATLFKQIVDKYPKSPKAGDALYWRAWSLHKIGADRRSKADLDEALAAIEEQQTKYANASSAQDGRVLRSQIRSAQASLGDAGAAVDIAAESRGLGQARGCTASSADVETRLAALEGLISMNSEDAVPILKEVLKQRDACRVELRKRALWLISTKRGADIAQTMLDVARNDPDGEVRGEAVFWLSQSQSELAIPLLDSILFGSKDEEVRKKAIFSLSSLAQRNDRARQSIRRAVEDEKMPVEVRGDAIFWLGNSKLADLDYFRTLFGKTRESELREKILFAVSRSSAPEATTWLVNVARDKTVDEDTRKNAIFHIAQRRAVDLDVLSSIYDQAKGDDEIQDQVLFAFSIRRESAAVDKLMAIAKNDPDVERRKKALFWLGQKNDPRVKAMIRDLIIRP